MSDPVYVYRLGGVDLNPSMNWKDRFQSYQVAQSVNRTVGGRSVVFAMALRAGRKITLESTQDTGWIDKATVEILMGMSASVGGSFLFEVGEQTSGNIEQINVIFRHNEAPALELTPIVNRAYHEDGDFFFGTIKLLTI